ncbi:hypothetical protein GIW81_04105 [Hyphomicrobium sp. xq]|uniref:HdeD family acid-resistance protein n=2 Tax=Hyphomicrobium album TaxID=2665159 RepID=A0A6I3KH80_9HYPH|nr:hypothetical protein [Hyphomicrobium album]
MPGLPALPWLGQFRSGRNAMAQPTPDSRPGQMIFAALAKKNDRLYWGGVAMAIVGALALLFPFGATLAIAIMAGWLLILAGAVTIADAFTVEGTGPFFGQLLIGLLKLVLGIYLVRHPDVSMVLLTLLLAAVFVIDGAAQLAMAFELRPVDGWGWLLLAGIVAIAVGILLAAELDAMSQITLGILLGVSFLTSGLARIAVSHRLTAMAKGR